MKKIRIYFCKNLIIIFLYLTLVLSFVLNENSSGGAEKDYFYTYDYILAISENLINGIKLLAYEHPQHFPLHYLFFSLLLKIFKKAYLVKFLYLHISILIPFIFFKCIRLVHHDKKVAFLLSIIIFASPYFRSSAVWATSDNLATLFFLSTIFFYLKFELSEKKIKNLYLAIFFFFLTIYTRQYYILFSIFFLLKLHEKKLFTKNFKKILLLIIILSIPGAMYFFYYYIYRISNLTFYFSTNLINNFFISVSIIAFYLIPFLIFSIKNLKLFFLFLKKELFYIFIIMIVTMILSTYFNYNLNPHGGGIIYRFFNSFLNLYIFFLFSSFFILMIIFFFKENIVINLTLLLIILLCFSFHTVFQKYFDPLLIILFSTLFKTKLIDNEIKKIKNKFIYYYTYFIIFYCISLVYNY